MIALIDLSPPIDILLNINKMINKTHQTWQKALDMLEPGMMVHFPEKPPVD